MSRIIDFLLRRHRHDVVDRILAYTDRHDDVDHVVDRILADLTVDEQKVLGRLLAKGGRAYGLSV